jgi:predicted regulator of Ras-like GTPase activity (Roadblock/LC7/MglB family)
MDAQQALADLTEISSQVRAAVVFDDKGKVAASTVPDGEAFAQAAADLLVAAEQVRAGESPLTQLEVATSEGAVFVVREGKATIAATTGADPTVGLVFYDLKSALRSVKPKPAPRRKPAETKTTATAKSTTAKSTTPKKKPAATRTKKKTDGS